MPNTETTRTCECGKDFTPTHWKQAYCCKQHAQHAYNARYRGHEPTWEIVTEFDCAQCDKHCVPGENVAPHASKFCGVDCKGKWHAKHNPSVAPDELKAQRRKVARHNAARRKLKRAACLPSSDTGFVSGQCACGSWFVSRQSQARTCSELCARRRVRKTQRARHGRLDEARKRARHFSVEYEPISRSVVFERDGYQCGICFEQTDPTANPATPDFPTVDHIIPISKGGPHLYWNVRCACFRCNTAKKDSIDLSDVAHGLSRTLGFRMDEKVAEPIVGALAAIQSMNRSQECIAFINDLRCGVIA